MPVKSILTNVDSATDIEAQMAPAVAATRHFDAHLRVLAIGYEPEMPPDELFPAHDLPVGPDPHSQAVQEASALAGEAWTRLKTEALRGNAVPLVVTPISIAEDFAAYARYVDLVVVGKPGSGGYQSASRMAFEGALFYGDAAVLVCPAAPDMRPASALVAWDASPGVLRSVRRSYPFLARTKNIEIALINPDPDQMRSADHLAVMLSRYDLKTSVKCLAPCPGSDVQILRRHQLETGAEFTVTGVRGRARFREFSPGEVTRDFPEMTVIPLFMAH